MIFTTNRLILERLSVNDGPFILALVNTPDWIKFVDDKKMRTLEEADVYIHKIITNKEIQYWVVKLKSDGRAAGIITFIRRAYLDHHDLGFAFLPEYFGNGYAYEAAAAVLETLVNDPVHVKILATTMKSNSRSIRLLEKLGFGFEKQVTVEGQTLELYAIRCTHRNHYQQQQTPQS